jgi:hypothetical protein
VQQPLTNRRPAAAAAVVLCCCHLLTPGRPNNHRWRHSASSCYRRQPRTIPYAIWVALQQPLINRRPAAAAAAAVAACHCCHCWLQVGQTTIDGNTVPVAVVDVSPARFPAPSWWSNAAAFDHTAPAVTASDQTDETMQPTPWKPNPDMFVFIKGQRVQLAAPPAGNGSMFLVDVSGASGAVQVGDAVCLLCEQQPAGELGKVGMLTSSLQLTAATLVKSLYYRQYGIADALLMCTSHCQGPHDAAASCIHMSCTCLHAHVLCHIEQPAANKGIDDHC